MVPALFSVWLSRCLYFDEADPEHIWVTYWPKEVKNVAVVLTTALNGSSTISVGEALGDWEFLHSGQWKWVKSDDQIAIAGLDLHPTITEKRESHWHWIKNLNHWASGSPIYVEHPSSKNWIFVHPRQITASGLLYFYHEDASSLNLRTRIPSKVSSLDQVLLDIDGTEVYARKEHIWNSVDEKAMWLGFWRREGETNAELASTVLAGFWFTQNQTMENLQNLLSVFLRQAEYKTYSRVTTSFTFPASATGCSILDENQYTYRAERLTPDLESDTYYRTKFAIPELEIFIVDGRVANFTSLGSGLYQVDNVRDNLNQKVNLRCRLKNWTNTGSSIIFTENFSDQGQGLRVLFPKKVRVQEPSLSTRIKSFNRTSPVFRWQAYSVDPLLLELHTESLTEMPEFTGLAEFE